MTSTLKTLPLLRVRTTTVADATSLLPLVDAHQPLLWMREKQGIAGVGEALRLEFTGPDRMRDAAEAWRAIAEAAEVDDPVRLPGSGLVAFGAFAFADDSPTTSVLVVPQLVIGRRGGTQWVTRIHQAGIDEDEVIAHPRPLGAEFRIALKAGSLTPDSYRAAVEEVVARIGRGDLEKVVLARDMVGHLPAEADLRRILADLALAYPDCWTYAVSGLIGASPETLVAVRNGTVSARVLAGTVARGRDAVADRAAADGLTSSPKDLVEHRLAVDSVLGALQPHCAALTWSEAPSALKLPNLWHLASDIGGVIADGSTSLALIDALHPTAAVAGSPTPDAVSAIAELEGFDRGRYAGPVGWVGADGDGEWAIALRCAQVSQCGDLVAYAGCGIVAGSEPEREYLETTMKFRPIADALG